MIALPFIHTIEPRSKDFTTITLKQLQALLQSSKGARIITLVTITEPDLKKQPGKDLNGKIYDQNPFANNCVKVSRINCIVNWSYTNSVNAQLRREKKKADFEPQPRKWGTRLKNSPFVSHVNRDGENKLYLETKIESSLGHTYYNPTTGLLIPNELIHLWLKEKQDARKFQGTDKEIILRDYNVTNIATIMIEKQGYIISENIA